MKQTLLIFVKNPEPGKVKTRLAADIGDEKAMEVYMELLAATMKSTLIPNTDREVWFSAFVDQEMELFKNVVQKKVQEGEDLGSRMYHALGTVLEKGNTKAVLIGSDCPSLSTRHIEEAFSLLDKADVVLGPSIDGGYYLIGLKEVYPELFTDIAWSTETVFEQTLTSIKKLNLSFELLESLNDIDTLADLEHYYQEEGLL